MAFPPSRCGIQEGKTSQIVVTRTEEKAKTFIPNFYMQADLTNCDREPIHIPGQIQSHGILIAVDNQFIIRYHSENITAIFPSLPQALLLQPISVVENILCSTCQPDVFTQLLRIGKTTKNFEQSNPYQLTVGGTLYNLIISAVPDGSYYLLEFEPAIPDMDVQRLIGRSVSEILSGKQLLHLLDNTAQQVKKVIEFDRVMVYRFAGDGHGEVVAEAKNKDLESWLGLHYPATDIPKQARELYKLNLTRLIADVNTAPSKIITYNDEQQQLNLTHSQLRAVSPVHIQYLKNMGVASSFSISLLYKNELWGLIACHNYTPKFIDYKARESSKLIGQILSSALEYRQDEENGKLNETYKSNVDKLARYLQKNSSVEDALTSEAVTLLNVAHTTGAVLVYENHLKKLGSTPDDAQIAQLLLWIKNNVSSPVYYTENISAVYPEAAAYKHIASGILVIVLSKELNEYVLWFKPEQLQTVNWAGNPQEPAIVSGDGYQHISPRNSFAIWQQTVMATSETWSVEEIKSVLRLKEEIMYAINLKASAIRLLNEKLRLAYDELDTFSYTISHDLKNPLTAIKSYAQILNRNESIDPLGNKLLQNIVGLADKMNRMINEVLEYSRIGRQEIQFQKINVASMISDITRELEQVYDFKNLQLSIGNTPHLQGDPVMLTQLFTNLLSNAIKYSQQSKPSQVRIEGWISDADVAYRISDNGIGIPVNDLPQIFELFNRLDNAKNFEGSGVGLAIVKRIVEKHNGRIWVESELGKGATFIVSFKNNLINSADQTGG